VNKNSAQVERISIPGGELHYYPHAFTLDESAALLDILLGSIRWTRREIMLYGRHVMMPRLIAWYSDPGVTYEYSGQSSPHNDWTPDLLAIKNRVETLSRHAFNGALLNYYRDGRDSMSWHSDDEESLGINPVIASVSFGATRTFRLRHRHDRSLVPVNLPLTTGSLLIMRGQTQHYWQHQLPKTRKPVGARINITFRHIKSSP
jgi:alkylated DNA repair dioxygenase AlkB